MAVLQGGGQNLPSPCVCYPKDPMWNRVKTKRVVYVSIRSYDPSFASNHFKFHFLWKTYSLASDDFCNPSATRVFVGTNAEDAKNI